MMSDNVASGRKQGLFFDEYTVSTEIAHEIAHTDRSQSSRARRARMDISERNKEIPIIMK
eukprot:6196810-Pleurochrysis_carterae.AAC.3